MQREPGKVSLEEAVDTLKRAGVPEDEMAALERQIAPPRSPLKEGMRSLGFVSGGVEEQRETVTSRKAMNPEEIELQEDDEDDEGGEGENLDIAQKAVPDAVYGDLASKARELAKEEKREAETEEPLGALARLKRQKKQ